MTVRDIALLRLSAQHIAQADFETPAAVVRHLGAMQAQDYAGAKWSIALRMPQATEIDIEQAVRDRQIVRTWPQRGTIHFVVPEELRWRLQLTAPRMLASARRRHDELGLAARDFAKAGNILASALQGDRQLARPDMMRALEDGGLSTAGQRGYHMLWHLALSGLICFGPLAGKQPTFALLDDWLPKVPDISHDEALARLARGYFVSHGPATLKDFAWWSGLGMTEARKALQLVQAELAAAVVSDTTYYLAPNLEPAGTPSAYLLPGFDEYSLGYTDRSAVLAAEHAPKTVPGGNGMFRSTIVVNGQIVGTWQRSTKKSAPTPILAPFAGPLGRWHTQLMPAQTRFLQYLGK